MKDKGGIFGFGILGENRLKILEKTSSEHRQQDTIQRVEDVIAISYDLADRKATIYRRGTSIIEAKPVERIACRGYLELGRVDRTMPILDVYGQYGNMSCYLAFEKPVTIEYTTEELDHKQPTITILLR